MTLVVVRAGRIVATRVHKRSQERKSVLHLAFDIGTDSRLDQLGVNSTVPLR
eukprot:COSAG05_NODE_5228_length_1231_cov_0.858657_1_plen_52_part_00